MYLCRNFTPAGLIRVYGDVLLLLFVLCNDRTNTNELIAKRDGLLFDSDMTERENFIRHSNSNKKNIKRYKSLHVWQVARKGIAPIELAT